MHTRCNGPEKCVGKLPLNTIVSTHVKVTDPVNFVLSVPPKAIEPLLSSSLVAGSKEIPIRSEVIVPWLKRLSVTVGTVVEPETVLWYGQ